MVTGRAIGQMDRRVSIRLGVFALILLLAACSSEQQPSALNLVEKEIKAANSRPTTAVVEPAATSGLYEDEGAGDAADTATPASEPRGDVAVRDEGGILEGGAENGDLLLISSEVTSTPEVCKA
jgi:hypothetical protein